MRSRKALAGVVLGYLFFSVCAYAQAVAGLGAVNGSVNDASGAVVPGATVTINNASKGIVRTIQTNDAGRFTAPSLSTWVIRRRPIPTSARVRNRFGGSFRH